MNKLNILVSPILLLMAITLGCSKESGPDEPTVPPEEEEYYTLRVLTYNIYHGETTNGDIDMDMFAEIISSVSPDLVALQEVDKNVPRSDYLDITNELSERTGLNGYFFKFRDYKGGEYGAAILSKFPVVDEDVVQGYHRTGAPRVLPFVKVEIDDGVYVYFNSSHLSTTMEEGGKQTQQLSDYYNNTINKAPLLIAGDLNLEPDSHEMEVLLNDDFSVSDTELLNTFSTRTGMRKKIDYVLYPNNENWEVISTERICRVDASDHCAFLSVLRFKKP